MLDGTIGEKARSYCTNLYCMMYLIFRLNFGEINKGILRGAVQNPLSISVYRPV